jgi:hypothetical protein
MKLFLFLTLNMALIACTQPAKNELVEGEKNKANTARVSEKYEVLTTINEDQGFGYQILKDGKLMIDQKNIPAIQGARGFSSKADAEKTANYVLEKIKKGAFPPTISVEELDSLGVID